MVILFMWTIIFYPNKNYEKDTIIMIPILQMSYWFIERLSNLSETTQFVNGRGWKSNPGSAASELAMAGPQELNDF